MRKMNAREIVYGRKEKRRGEKKTETFCYTEIEATDKLLSHPVAVYRQQASQVQ